MSGGPMCSICQCETGSRLYKTWAALLDQRRPKADRQDIRRAEAEFKAHRATCPVCKEKNE